MSTELASVREQFDAFVARYGPEAGEEGPVLYAREVLGINPDPWQEEVLRAYGRGERQMAVASCHGVGKSLVASICITHQQATRFPQVTALTAPTKGQLEDVLWKEVVNQIRKWPKFLQELFNVTSSRVEFRPSNKRSFCVATTARDENPEALQGRHEDEGWVLLVVDEASGVGDPVYESSGGSMSGPRCQMLLLSNPTRLNGYFYDCFHSMRSQWRLWQIGYLQSTRVDRAYVESMRARHGEHSNAFRIRCLGLFPLGDDDSVFPLDVVASARGREIEPLPGTIPVWGIDVAGAGRDRSVLMKRTGKVLDPDFCIWRGKEQVELISLITGEWQRTPPSKRPGEIIIDATGLGAGLAGHLCQLGLPAIGINASEAPVVKNTIYRNRRSEMFFMARDWFMARDCKLPGEPIRHPSEGDGDQIEGLIEELCAFAWDQTDTGKTRVENNKEVAEKIKRSPDLASAFVLTFGSAFGGGAQVRDQRTPSWLKRFKTGAVGRMK